VKKPEPFLRRLFQAAVEIINKKLPKATFIDFHGCVSFHRPPLPNLSFFLVLFLSLSRYDSREEIIRATIVYRRRWKSCPTLGMPEILVHMAPPAAASGRRSGFFLSLLFFRLSVNRILSQSNSWIEQ
jgi:hypothetical protein